jgi:hypothetical protein
MVFGLSQLSFAQILKGNDLKTVRAFPVSGCGRGTNARRFAHAKYLGIDINDRYIPTLFRLVLTILFSLTVFFTHLDTSDAQRVLSRTSKFLAPDVHLHSVELVLLENAGIPRWLALHDRGKFPRSLSTWSEIFTDNLETVIFELFLIHHLGRTIMELIFHGRVKQ